MQYTAEFLKKVYRDLLSVRLFEEKQVEVYALGKVPGHIHSGIGEEAVCTGVMATRKEGDYFKISHRPVGAGLVLGAPLETMFAELMGKATGNAKGLGGVLHMTSFQHGMVGFSGTLGSDIAVADGAALTIQMAGTDNVSYGHICFSLDRREEADYHLRSRCADSYNSKSDDEFADSEFLSDAGRAIHKVVCTEENKGKSGKKYKYLY